MYKGLFKGCKKEPIDIIIPLVVYSVFTGVVLSALKQAGMW